jgi:hypothetical protein
MKDRQFKKLIAKYIAAEVREDLADEEIKRLMVSPAIELFKLNKPLEAMRLVKAMPKTSVGAMMLIGEVSRQKWWDLEKNPISGIGTAEMTPAQAAAKVEYDAASKALDDVLDSLVEEVKDRAKNIFENEGEARASAFCGSLPKGIVRSYANEAIREVSKLEKLPASPSF